jgi:fibronectin-binding autotransporter adhesin
MNTTRTLQPLRFTLAHRQHLLVCSLLLSAATVFGATTRTWVGTAGNNLMGDANNWSPAAVPSSSANDTLLWNGSQAGNLLLTNSLANFDANPGFYINVTAAQTGSISLVESNGATTRIRLNGTNTFNLATGAGAFNFGNGGTTALPIAPAGRGNGEIHNFTNNSANPVTFNSETYLVMGGGGTHTLLFAGPGTFNLNSSLQAQNSGAGGALNVSGATVNLVGAPAPGIVYAGTYGTVTLSAGTLALAAPSAIGVGNTIVLAGGSLDSTVANLVNSGNNPQSWNGNFGFVGSQNLDLGLGPVTMNASRIVTVNANTLTVGGGIAGNNFSLTKAGSGTLALNGFNTYTAGTIISNGVLRIGNGSAIPSASAPASAVTVYGTLDINGNAVNLSALNGTGIVDTLASGTPTLTVGNFDTNSAFSGSIRNTSGALSLFKTGLGTLTLGGASTYSGGTVVSAGTLLVTNLTGSGTGSGAVSVSSGGKFGGSGSVTGAVTWDGGASGSFSVTAVGGANTTPLTVAGSVTLNGNTITVNVTGAIPLDAGIYTLMTYNNAGSSGTFASGGVSYTGVGVSPGTVSSVSTSGGSVVLTVTSVINGTHTVWTNNADGNWSAAANWLSNSVPHSPGDLATLGFGTAYRTATLDANESVGAVVFTNANSFAIGNAGQTLTFDNSGAGALISVAGGTSNRISTAVSLNDNLAVSTFPATALVISNVVSSTSAADTILVNGAGTLALAGNNTYGPSAGTAGTIVTGTGILELDNSGALGAGDLDILNTSTVRAGAALNTANNIVITNGVTGTFDNAANNVTLSGTISGAGALAKNGAGALTLSGANSYNGDTSISAGTVKLGNATAIPGGTGNGNVNMGTNTTLDLNGFSPVLNGLNSSVASSSVDNVGAGAATLTLGESGSFATFMGSIKQTGGTIALVKDGAGNETLGGTNSYTGGTTINAGILRVGNGNTNTAGSLIAVGLGSGAVLDNATLEFNLAGTNIFTNAISGSGTLNLANTNLNLFLTGANTFSGNVTVSSGGLWVTNPASLGTGPKTVVVVGGGNSLLTQLHLAGNVTVDPSISYQLSYLNGVLLNESGNNTLQGNIVMSFGGGNAYVNVKSGFLTLSGNVSSDGNANGRTLQLGGAGNGLFSGVMFDTNSQVANLQKSDAGTWSVTGASTTIGTVTAGGGTLIFNGSWVGPAVVNSGATLTGNGLLLSNLTVNAGGLFVPGAYGSIGTFTVATNLALSGATYVSLNKSLAQSNSTVLVPGGATANTGSSLVVSNLGPALVAGDTFKLFSQPVTNGNLMSITGPANVSFTNNLAVDGTISVLPNVSTTRTNISATLVGNELRLTWPADHTGWHLQIQTNAPGTGLGTNWVTIPGTDASNGYTNTIDPTKGSVFFRMIYP